MSTVVLDGIKGDHPIKEVIIQRIKELGETCEYFKLEQLMIKPCRNCGGCSYKTPGECILKDDMPTIIREIVKADRRITITPVTGKELDQAGHAGKKILKGLNILVEDLIENRSISTKAQRCVSVKIPSLLSTPLAVLLNYVAKKDRIAHGVIDFDRMPYK